MKPQRDVEKLKAEVIRLQDENEVLNKVNLSLLEKQGKGKGHYQVELTKAGKPLRKRKELDKDRYNKLHEAGYTQPEIARALGMSVNTLKRRLREQREDFRDYKGGRDK